jgi:hypothetical protein
VDLEEALGQFDAVEANLRRLEDTWSKYVDLIPVSIVFTAGSPEGRESESVRRSFDELASALPAIDGWRIEERPLALDDIARTRLDAAEISEPQIEIGLERQIHAPGEQIAEYRFRFNRARQRLVRKRILELIERIDTLLATLPQRFERDSKPASEDSEWQTVVSGIAEIERLAGGSLQRKGDWLTLKRHIAFGQGVDIHDIAERDWPSVRPDIEASLYDDLEPLPVEVDDLGTLAASGVSGPVSTKLVWSVLDDEHFERLVYNILLDAPGYDNVQWLTQTNAPDRARDVSAERTLTDALAGVQRQRVIVQCKHWTTRSVNPDHVSSAVTKMALWEPPPVDALIIATSGRFTNDAVDWIEKHNNARKRPMIEAWPESHLESLLAQRPGLVAEFRLRPSTA